MDEYTNTLLTIENLEELIELFRAAFNKEPKEGFVHWKYFTNPAGSTLLAGAFYRNKLVASGAMIPEKMNILNKEVTVYKCTDLMTHPDHQRRGLSKKINELLGKETAKMNTPFSYTLCSNIATKSFLKNNWIFLERVTNFFKPYVLLKASNFFRKKPLTTFGFYDNVSNHLNKYRFYVNPSNISVNKSAEYVRWRTSNPNFTYRIICNYDKNKEVNGYLIYSISVNNLLNVIDVQSSDRNKKVINQLLRCAEYVAVKEQYKGVLIMAIKNTPFYRFVKSRNYLRNPFNKGPLISILDFDIYLFDKSMQNICNLSLWDINGMSYDDI